MTTPLSPDVEKAIDEANDALDDLPWSTAPILRALAQRVAQRVSEIERRDERRKALLEACAAACNWCRELGPENARLKYDKWRHHHNGVHAVCQAPGIRALLVVEGEPEQKEGA